MSLLRPSSALLFATALSCTPATPHSNRVDAGTEQISKAVKKTIPSSLDGVGYFLPPKDDQKSQRKAVPSSMDGYGYFEEPVPAVPVPWTPGSIPSSLDGHGKFVDPDEIPSSRDGYGKFLEPTE